ncbi:hypothetical protein P0W64_00605 [Tsukamurella sp. 8F]|uniref:hypothetical protein n=1 Tax=unclassified Tsukamurella TaxID=2633480 RepID=UPI0023B8D78D|nr:MULTISPECIES: hypothetical protein [unclassified Tsukamurella]MDF0531420.1 hypothetical protein [Tsukamurella sp. 8J]MDF0585274.1 hypothetical protein [Tsukamurella sp. 8F]
MTGLFPPLQFALDAAEPKPEPEADRADKKNYAQKLSNALAQTVADALRPMYPDITPTATGAGQEAQIDVVKGRKKLDVKSVDPNLGLVLCVSIKTYSFPDFSGKTGRAGRYTKNIVRNDHELRGEAMVLHQRQPYSVLVAVMFEPYATCGDGNPDRAGQAGQSSFAKHVETLAKRSGRGRRAVVGGPEGMYVDLGAEDTRHDLFERVFIGLYEVDGPDRGTVRFFDAEQAPPRCGRPADDTTLSFDEFVSEIHREVARRNRLAPTWSDADADFD